MSKLAQLKLVQATSNGNGQSVTLAPHCFPSCFTIKD